MHVRPSPGPCLVCGAEHAACTRESGQILVTQLPSRDAGNPPMNPPRLVAEIVQDSLPEGQVTTGTYRRKVR